jgi:hypothetical protein
MRTDTNAPYFIGSDTSEDRVGLGLEYIAAE